jgi:hypothetical protein
MTVEDLIDPGLHLQSIDVKHGPPPSQSVVDHQCVMLIITGVP